MTQSASLEFGFDAFGLDDRMRLFGYITAENRHAYRWVLRVVEASRNGYQTVLSTDDIAAALNALRAADTDCPDPAEIESPRLLDSLREWGVLERGQDSTRARTLVEYRNRHSVYQFTEAGWRAHRAVESVLNATMAETGFSRAWCSRTCCRICTSWRKPPLRVIRRRSGCGSTASTGPWPMSLNGPRASTP